VKYFLFARLLPQWLQSLYWQLIVPRSLIEVASQTAKEILPKLTSDKKLISLLSSMWIDTGARPDVASFMMTAAVFRGVAMEGGCYPREGSEAMAIELAKVVNDHGGVS
jgi:phytoene dehydrogenase-like protein